ncbi:MAG TPA: sugar transferase [Elusimicrobia bacterium]|nr:sugar transferase [Elusimicrobiota bacterium]
MPNSFYARSGKRVFDLIAVACGIVFLSPLFVLAALAVKLGGRGPVLFSHRRIGLNFKPFFTHKFRTMTVDADKHGPAITAGGDARITPMGRLLRKTKLDELPQLFNVLKGEMSLVGPRPEVAQYVEMFKEDYKTVLSVRPGITDYAAIEYRDEVAVLAQYSDPQEAYVQKLLPAKILLYKKYIAEQSFLTDLKILVRTLIKLFS